ncbi:MAG: hypothetical protein AB1585_13315 [Thermodesulfobacteriota bacterium]
MRCEKLGGTWSEGACIKYQDAGRFECRDCQQGKEVRENMNAPEATKFCKKCGQDKPRSAFSPDKKSRDKLRPYCKACTAALTREYHEKKKREAIKPVRREGDRSALPTSTGARRSRAGRREDGHR